MSRTQAKKILGVSTKTETHVGKKYTVYRFNDAGSEPLYIPTAEDVVDTLSTALLLICIETAGSYGIKDNLVPDADIDQYRLDAAKGGKLRQQVVIKPDGRGLITLPPRNNGGPIHMLDLSKATHVRLEDDTVLRLEGQLLNLIMAANLVVDPYGDVKMRQGVTATGPYDPASFARGMPDCTPETLLAIAKLLGTTKEKFTERYGFYMMQAPTEKTLEPIPLKCEGGPLGQDNKHFAQHNSALEVLAAKALVWLRDTPGCQLAELKEYSADVYHYATDVIEVIGKGTKRDRLTRFMRSLKEPRTLLEIAADAQQRELLPPVELSCPSGLFEATPLLVFLLTALKWTASMTIAKNANPLLCKMKWSAK